MPNILIRDLDAEVLARLKAAAKRHGRSLQAEMNDALERATATSLAETRRLSARWLKRLRRSSQSDSTRLIREDREKALPFEVKVPNRTTVKAMKVADRRRGKRFKTAGALFKDLGI